jgi:hypothetical protein
MNGSVVYKPEPLAWRDVPDVLTAWAESLRSDRFWVMLLDNVKASARVRDAVAKAVVWLEMKEMAGQANVLDDAAQAMRRSVFACRQTMVDHGPSQAKDVPEVQTLRDAWVESVEHLRSVVVRTMGEVPAGRWEGIDE